MFAKILKANPYHGADGRFSSKNSAKFVSVGPSFSRGKLPPLGAASSNLMSVVVGDDKARMDRILASRSELLGLYGAKFFAKQETSLGDTAQEWTKTQLSVARGSKVPEAKLTEMRSGMSEYLSANSLKDGTLYRGVKGTYAETLQSLKQGDTLTTGDLTSTSASPDLAKAYSKTEGDIFGRDASTLLRFSNVKGVKGAPIDPSSHQAEVVLMSQAWSVSRRVLMSDGHTVELTLSPSKGSVSAKKGTGLPGWMILAGSSVGTVSRARKV